MNCNIFKNGLDDYILGVCSNDLKIALEKHMEQCESCKLLYEEELKLDRDFKLVLSIDGIEFNSSRASIINSIDKNRYSKKTSNKMLYNFKKYKNRYLSYAVAVIAMVVFIPMLLRGFGGGNYSSESPKNNTTMYKTSEESIAQDSMKTDAAEGSSMLKSAETKTANKAVNAPLEFKRTMITKQALPNYEMKWKNSTDGKSSAAIDIAPEKDVDFGIHAVYIKNMATNEIVRYEVINNERQFTPRNIEWWDNDHLIIVAGLGFGTVAYGTEVYSLDVNTSELSTLYQTINNKQQILNLEKVEKDLILQLLIYEDDNYTTSHKGVGKMTLLEVNSPTEMQIISEEKK